MRLKKHILMLFLTAILLIASFTVFFIVRQQQKLSHIEAVLTDYLTVCYPDRELFDWMSMEKEALADTALHIAVYHGKTFPFPENGQMTQEQISRNLRDVADLLALIVPMDKIYEYFDEKEEKYIFPPHKDEPTHTYRLGKLRQMGETYYGVPVTYLSETGEELGTDFFTFDFHHDEIDYSSVTKNADRLSE